MTGKQLKYGQWSAAALKIDGDIDSSNALRSRLSISAQRAGYGTRLVDTLDAKGEGTALEHRIAMNVLGLAQTGDVAPRAQLEVTGKFEKETWTASIATTQFSRGNPAQQIKIAEPASAVLSREEAMLDNFCLVIAQGRLCAEGRWQRDGRWQAEVSGYEIPLATVLPSAEEEVEYAGRIEGSARAFGAPNVPWQGEAGMKISDAAIIYRPEGAEPETLNLGTGGMHLVAKPEQIDFSFGVQAFTDTYLHTNAHLIRNGEPNVLKLPLRGELRARAADANLLPIAFPEVDHAAGVLAGSATIGGTLERPEINGRIELANGELDSYRVNFALRDLDVIANIDSNRLDFTGNGKAGDGRLQVEGDFTWTNGSSKGTMRLKGEELLVADLPEYRVVASPDLRFDIGPKNIRVNGDVLIPNALVQPASLSGAVGHSADARYVGEHEAEQAGRYVVQSDVRVQMGKEVRVDAFGLHARIEGGVTTRVQTGETTTGHGELRVAEGRYEAYGQQLDISRGQLIFDNAPLDDPGLDIEARRRVETVTVGLNVRGTLQEPRLTFFSDPSMPQTQIVSYLLVGKPLNATAASDSQDMTAASDTLALQGGGFLASQLGRRLGIEEVGVENYINSAGEANPSLVLGKFLSPRLFISYGISLTESINTLKLRYTISDRWIFRTESGEAQSADLEYTIER
jgi:translocation and assembly module TamB